MSKARQGGAGAWVYRYRGGWRVFYRRESGGVLSGSRVLPTKAEAETLAEELRAQITSKRRTVREAVEAYGKDMEARGRRDSTVSDTKQRIRNLLGPVLDSPLAALTARRADGLYQALVESGKYAVSSHHAALDAAKAFCGWSAHRRRRWLRENPFANVEKVGKRADHRSECLRVDEARAFRDEALALARAGDVGALAALLALVTSLRSSEIVQIEARDVDDGGAILWIAGARLKTDNTRRPMEIADEDLRALLVGLAAGKAPSDRLIPHWRGFVADSARRIAEAAGVPKVNARELRRTFATLAARRGRSLDDLAFSMGHGADATATTARQHYIAPGAREAGAAGRVLGVLDGGKRGKPADGARH